MTIYTKTEKGRAELTNRSNNIPPKTRRALILCNGQIDSEEIAKALGSEDTQSLLDWLVQEKFITREKSGASNDPITDELQQLPAERSQDDFIKAKNFMVNTIGHYHGQYGHLSLKSEINATRDFHQLRQLYLQWEECMNKLKQFKKLKKELFKVL